MNIAAGHLENNSEQWLFIGKQWTSVISRLENTDQWLFIGE